MGFRSSTQLSSIKAIDAKKARVFRLRPLIWQGWRDSNSQHADLESAALPIGATPLNCDLSLIFFKLQIQKNLAKRGSLK